MKRAVALIMVLLLAAGLLAGCGGSGGAPQGGSAPQGGNAPQSGNVAEAGNAPQAGSAPQGESEPQSGNVAEAGNAPQAGSAPQGGSTPQGGNVAEAGNASQAGSTAESGSAPQAESALQAGSAPQARNIAEAGSAPQAGNAPQSGSTPQSGSVAEAGSPPQTAQVLLSVQSETEILTYEKIDPQKTLLVVSRTGNVDIMPFSDAFEAQNPDVQVICLDITGGNSAVSPVVDWVLNGRAPDVMLVAGSGFSQEQTTAYFQNLSTHPVISQYEAEALSRQAVNDNIYWLPGPSNVDCMIYNKTLFEQYGWEAPRTFDEFVALCVRIREDTGGAVQPWNPNAKYSDEFLKVTEGFVYEELLGGMKNRVWYHGFCEGKQTFAGHMEPYYQMLQTLIDNGLLLEEHFSYSATTRGKEFDAGKIAMCNRVATAIESDEYEFDFLPFPGTVGELGYVCDNPSLLVGVPKKQRTEQERDALNRFLAFFSSEEGQRAFIGQQLMVSHVKGVTLEQAKKMASLQPALNEGHLYAKLDFVRESGERPFFSADAQAMLRGEKTAAECIAQVDAGAEKADAGAENAPVQSAPAEVIATASEGFTLLETSFLLADLYREASGAQIGLINHGMAYRGNLMRIFKGDLTADHVTVLKPRSFANDSALVKLSMTGRQLLDALNHPMGNECETNSVYAFSGLVCEVAPWNAPGEKYLSVKLADGTPIDETALYAVGAWEGTVDEKYVTETLARTEGSFEELLTQKLRDAGTIAPAKDGRITLVWE